MPVDIEKYFEIADRNLNCNTAYPIFKEPYKQYMSDKDILKDVRSMCFYIHIPFCERICRFCEYTRFLAGDSGDEQQYLRLLEKQIDCFIETHNIESIHGFDIGGGTPTALSEDGFESLMRISSKLDSEKIEKSDEYEKSIEFSFSTISERKLELILSHGFKRISTGIQLANYELMRNLNRHSNDLEFMKQVFRSAHDIGIDKINIDLMYGLPGQNDSMIDESLATIGALMPENVTLYETRFNRGQIKNEGIDRDRQYQQYKRFFDGLLRLGYKGRFGRNTFTLCDDHGVSSYLHHRMWDAIPYKGFGISAQSMSNRGISYGVLKNSKHDHLPKIESLGLDYNYWLPPAEIAAKYICIAMYSAKFSLDTVCNIISADSYKMYRNELEFLKEKKYIRIDENTVYLTGTGFRYYGAVAALFWSEEQKEYLIKDVEEKNK